VAGVKTERATAVEVTSSTSKESRPSSVEVLRDASPPEAEEGGEGEERDAGGAQGRMVCCRGVYGVSTGDIYELRAVAHMCRHSLRVEIEATR